MRPIKLEMNNFGPYRHVVIDFTQLAATPLFLISGKTGAGKTTIFDGMTYALYGETTSKERDVKSLHADFARHELCTVQMVFEHEGVRYQISRQPQQQVQGRGNKLVNKQAKVSLIYPLDSDQPTELTKLGQVKDFIVKLLKLNADQFSQIVLLPQGRFRKFLSSDSNEKEKLLRDLFRTELYADWEQEIKNLLDKQKDSQNDLQTRLQTLQNQVSQLDNKLPLSEWLSGMQDLLNGRQKDLRQKRQDLQVSDKKVQQLNQQLQDEKQLNQQIEELRQIGRRLQDLAEQETTMKQLRKRIDQLNWFAQHQDGYISWSRSVQELKQLDAQLEQSSQRQKTAQENEAKSREKLNDLQKQDEEMKQLDRAMASLAGQLPLYQAQEQLGQKIKADREAKHESEKALDQANKTLAAHQEELATVRQDIGQLNQGLLKKADLVAEKSDWQIAHDLWEHWQDNHDQSQQAAKKVKSLQAENAANKDQVTQAQQAYNELQDMQIKGQIMSLVEQLHDGQACPVCGSLDHPHPAALEDIQPVDSKQLKSAAKRLSQANRDQAAAESKLEKAQDELAGLLKTADEDWGKLQEKLPLGGDNPGQVLLDWQEILSTKEKQMAEDEASLAKLQKRQPQLQDLLEQEQGKLQKLQAESQQADLQLAKDQAAFNSQSAGLDKLTLTEAKSRLARGRQELKQYNEQLHSAQDQLSSAHEEAVVAQQAWQRYSQEKSQQSLAKTKLRDQLQADLAAYDSDLDWDFWQEAARDLGGLSHMQAKANAYYNQRDNLTERQQALKETVQDKKAADLGQTRSALANAQKEQSAIQETVGRLQEQRDQLLAKQEEISKLGEAEANLLEKMKELQTLSDVVSGKTDNKLSLERYILQNYFGEVLDRADPWLQQLSNGRYYFKLDTRPGSGNGSKWSGLEVDIYDDMAGQYRSARTLSGGESFIASLSLALALSEVVQEHHGGVHIDALFVDEGFGSLDQNALDHALQALQNIKGGRMVGIISHVSELEERLPNQLHVISENGVSRVEYQLDAPVN